MPEPDDEPVGDENITVRCMKPDCQTDYTTSAVSFESRSCRCPLCDGSKAQFRGVPK